jgi:hypothetical protein
VDCNVGLSSVSLPPPAEEVAAELIGGRSQLRAEGASTCHRRSPHTCTGGYQVAYNPSNNRDWACAAKGTAESTMVILSLTASSGFGTCFNSKSNRNQAASCPLSSATVLPCFKVVQAFANRLVASCCLCCLELWNWIELDYHVIHWPTTQ